MGSSTKLTSGAGLLVVLVVLAGAGFGAAAIGSPAAVPAAATSDTETATTTTATATATSGATTTATTGAATTATTATVKTATAVTGSTAAAPATTAVRSPTKKPVRLSTRPSRVDLDHGCLVVGALAVLEPRRPPLTIGPVARAPHRTPVSSPAVGYPADSSLVATAAISVRAPNCGAGRSSAGGAAISTLSLFGGAVTARSIVVETRDGRQTSKIDGLRVRGRLVPAGATGRVAIGSWATLRTAAPWEMKRRAAKDSEPRARSSALELSLLEPHGGLPAGTTILVGFTSAEATASPPAAAAPRSRPALSPRAGARRSRARVHATGRHRPRHKANKARPRHRSHRRHVQRRHARPHGPLSVTPRLARTTYVFPVVGAGGVSDSYGVGRADVSWHHGDDLFAPFGTPVVAVANGTLNRVGWERLGGWRLWVRDRAGNEFYYAHLAGYTPAAVARHPIVEAGEVIGFLGNSGDAFTTPPHLHFEIHPRSLLRLKYDGAVNPTSYLEQWRVRPGARAANPVLPALPSGPAKLEARYLFQKLLAVRHVLPPTAAVRTPKPKIRLPGPADGAIARRPAAHGEGRSALTLFGVGAGALAAVGAAIVLLRRRLGSRRPSAEQAERAAALPVEAPPSPSRVSATARSEPREPVEGTRRGGGVAGARLVAIGGAAAIVSLAAWRAVRALGASRA